MWNSETERTFKELKNKFIIVLILIIFDLERQIMIKTDISDFIIGLYINQLREDGQLRLITFYSRKMISAELNYETYDKELLIIIKEFREGRMYLKGFKYPIQIYTDHKNLIYFTTIKALIRR